MKRIAALCLIWALMLGLTSCKHTHSFGVWRTVKKASCAEDGQKERKCACGEKETAVLKQRGHEYAEEGTWEPDCNGAGEKTFICTVCGDTYTEAFGKKTDHDYKSEITKTANCAQEGEMTYTCSICSDSYTEAYGAETYTATELYDMYKDLVGEVLTYDKQGNGLGLGSCVVYAEDGRLLTNYHVIEGAYYAEVVLGDETYDIEDVIAYDKNIDLAIVTIDETGLTPAEFCTEDHVVGAPVYTLGNSRGLTSTFADGMITYSNREVEGVAHVQHSAPISGGNSGGPLINEYGEVIGINTWYVTESQNLNFAVHISEVENLEEDEMSLRELYNKECDPYAQLKELIVTEGTEDKDYDGFYTYDLKLTASERSAGYYLAVAYDEEYDELCFGMVIEEQYCFSFYIEEYMGGTYDWMYFDDDYEIYGEINAGKFTERSTLDYDRYDVPAGKLADYRELADAMAHYLLSVLDEKLAEVGVNVTVADLGFTKY